MDRSTLRLLLLIAAAGLIPRIAVGIAMPIGFDGWWHLFAATQEHPRLMFEEWVEVAHPPLFYPLLRILAYFGHSHLILRSAGILCGAACTVVLGIVASKIYRHKTTVLLAASAYTFSWSMIELNCDLRAYPIALLFVLLACNAFLDWLHDSTNSRALTRFGIFTALGLFTEFFVVFFIAGCFAILALRCALNPDFRTALRTSLREHSRQWAVAAGIPMLVFLGFFTFHKTARMEDLPYLRDYIWSSEHHTDPISFLYSNIVHEASYFASLGLSPAAVLALLFLFILPGLFYFLLKRRDLANGIFSATPIVLAGAILAQIMVLALAAKYPFGGEFRHQSIAVPFLFLAVFLLLDLLAGVLSAPMFRHGLFMLAGAVTAANFAYGLTTYAWHEPEPRAADYIRFRQQFPAAENIYADQSSAIYFYGRHNAAKWTLLHHYLLNDQNVFSYTVESGYAAPFRFIRIREQTWFDPAAPLSYQLLAAAMREEKIGSAVLYFVSRTWDDDATTALRELIRKHAPAAGISVGRNDIGRDYAFIEFQLK